MLWFNFMITRTISNMDLNNFLLKVEQNKVMFFPPAV